MIIVLMISKNIPTTTKSTPIFFFLQASGNELKKVNIRYTCYWKILMSLSTQKNQVMILLRWKTIIFSLCKNCGDEMINHNSEAERHKRRRKLKTFSFSTSFSLQKMELNSLTFHTYSTRSNKSDTSFL